MNLGPPHLAMRAMLRRLVNCPGNRNGIWVCWISRCMDARSGRLERDPEFRVHRALAYIERPSARALCGAYAQSRRKRLSYERCIARTLRGSQKASLRGQIRRCEPHETIGGEIQSPQRYPHSTLSNREYQIMLFLAAGKVPKEIGSELSSSSKTFSTYRLRVLEKLKLRDNTEKWDM